MTDKKKTKKNAILLLTLACVLQSGCAFMGKSETKVVTVNSESYYKDDATRTYINYEDGAVQGDEKETTILQADELDGVELSYAADYFLMSLTEKECEVYKQIFYGLQNFEPQIYITNGVIKQEDICSFIVLCTTTVPAINYIGEEYTVSIDDDGYVTAVKVNYSKTQEEAAKENAELEKRIDTIVSKLHSDWTDYDKVKYFHDTIIKNCQYNEQGEYAYSAYGALCKGEAVCEGYTKAMLLLCEKAGIGCIPVIGEGLENENTLPHIWNKIIINNYWYDFDLTWDDPVNNISDDYIRYDYFAINDTAMGADHIIDENMYLNYPSADAGDNYFVRSGLYAENADEAVEIMKKAVSDAMAANDDYARIKCADAAVYAQAYENIFKAEEGQTTEIFRILREVVEENGYEQYSNQGYSEITNADMFTLTIRLNRK